MSATEHVEDDPRGGGPDPVSPARGLVDDDALAIADAVLRITARDGLHQVSIRTVAVEAGRSVGMVQRRFGSKDHLLLAAMRRVIEQVGGRIRAQVEALGPDPELRVLLECLTRELVTVGPERRDEAMVWLAFLARAVVVPELAAELREQYVPGGHRIATALRDRPGLDPELAAVELLALVDGLTAHVLLGRIDEATALRALHAQLDRLLPSS
ncbi:MAG TPA: TetR family transcriptional regulator C-terminal domain-containing protein [Pseudonocardia sp.]|nr:TetR family transcriptional regulator C-terminal domain-containing protein [Pseudonocardia sp.]